LPQREPSSRLQADRPPVWPGPGGDFGCRRPGTLDVTDRKAVEAGMSHVEQSFGRIDVLINNAGI
jgi:NAD(P)-dependent dehydrogenase (short-subunit alcohol dehydrogenase family)